MDVSSPRRKKFKKSTKEELLLLDKEELVERILQLEAHNTQLRNIISKGRSDSSSDAECKRKREFDFSKCHQRRILLHLVYFGWDYQGLAVQEGTRETVEHYLFETLTRTCLIESRETSQYHRCGRTDKGVSAFGQVISLSIRSKYPPEDQYTAEALATEIRYCKILNNLLPKEIRAIAWMPIPKDMPEYSARFDCKKRQYKYYFPRSNLDIQAMRDACTRLVGSHDFRNLCKMDVGNGVTVFRRHVLSADVVPIDPLDEPTSMYCLIIEGNAFLWHQIRCIMGVLLLVGEGREASDVIPKLLNVEANPRKPQYDMALDIPLNLFHCSYDLEETSEWVLDEEEFKCIIKHLQCEWTIFNIKSTMIKDSLQQLEAQYSKHCVSETDCNTKGDENRLTFYTDCLTLGSKPRVYVPLSERVTCCSLEERVEYYRRRGKLIKTQDEPENE